MKTVFVINNKNNRLVKKLPELKDYYREAELGEVDFQQTVRQKHAIGLAREASDSGCDFLIAVGGDGTLHEVINGVLQSHVTEKARPVVGLLPFGSANDFARTAGISKSFEALVECIRSHSIRTIDLGRILIHASGTTRYFINIAGLGLGAEVVQNLEGSSSVLGPRFNYFRHIIQGFIGYSKKEVRCTSREWQWQGKLLQMAVANGRYFGNAICIAPDARITDGKFQLAVFGDLSLWDYLKNLGKLKKGIKIDHEQVHYHDDHEIWIESKDRCGIEADGEFVGFAPATLSIVPGAISFLMPDDSL